MRKALSVLCALLLLALPLGSLAECAHIWRDGAVLTEGTCVTQGERQIVCTKCGAQSTRTYYGPPLLYHLVGYHPRHLHVQGPASLCVPQL